MSTPVITPMQMTKKVTFYNSEGLEDDIYELNKENVHDIQILAGMNVMIIFKNKATKLYANMRFIYEELPTNIVV